MGEIRKRLLIAILSAIMLVGCGERLREGEIYRKEYLPENTMIHLVPMIHYDGKTSTTTYIPMMYYYPDRWRIDIRSLNPDEDGDYDTDSYFVNSEVYDACEVGDIFSYDPDRDYESEPVIKEKVAG